MIAPITRFYEFGPFSIDAEKRVLERDGYVVPLAPKAFDTLLALVQNAGQVLEKNQLIEMLWPDSFVEEGNLTYNVSAIRKALGESPNERKYIVTVSGKGYKFAADVKKACDDASEVVAARSTKSTPVIQDQEHGQEIKQKPERLPHASVSSTRRLKLVCTGAAIAILAVVAGLYYLFSRPTKESVSPLIKIIPFTNFPGREDHAVFSPDGNQIAFVWGGEKDDNPDIYVKSVGGERPLRLTSDPAIDIRPTWSPDGQRIAFVRIIASEHSFTVFVVSVLGTTPERRLLSLSRGPSTLAWSPDGKFIAVSDAPSSQDHPGIVLFSPETGEKRNLTSPPAQFRADSNPAFSPDSKTLAFIRENTAVSGDIYIVPITGGEPRRITYDNANHNFNSGIVGGLAWTADGREIIFSSTRGGIPGLWRVEVSGGDPERLAVGGDNAYYPSCSLQGHRLAYTQVFGGTPVYRIEVSNSKGGRGLTTRLIASTQVDTSPQYSPAGKRIAFGSNRSGTPEIWVCESEGQNPTRLTSFGKGIAGTPRWSPDGQRIAFDFRAKEAADIYVLDVAGGVPQRITTEASDDSVPSWSKDGSYIYFTSDRSGDLQIWRAPAEGGQAVRVTKQCGFEAFESADGKYLYYSKGSIAPGVWRVPVEGGDEVLVLDNPGAGSWVGGQS